MKKLRVFETFAGIGAQHKALSNLKEKGIIDYEVVAISEWDIDAIIAYNAIHGANVDYDNAIDYNKYTFSSNGKSPTNINRLPESRKEELFNACKALNNLGSITEIKSNEIPDIDLLTYSFPCQDLSIASMGRGKGMVKGSGTRSGLLWEIERIIKGLDKENRLPKYLLLENVPAIKSQKNSPELDKWLEFLTSKGYTHNEFILDASDFGIPQGRKRYFCLSILNGKNHYTQEDVINYYKEYCKKNKKKNLTLKSIFKSSEKYKDELIESTPNDTPSRRRMRESNHKLEDENLKQVRTITTKQDRHPNAGMKYFDSGIKGKLKARFLTPRECYMLMGFSTQDFSKAKSKNIRKEKLYQQAGNSIVVNVLEAIFLLISMEEE